MAISDEMLGLSLAVVLMYYILFNHKIRWVRMIGCISIIIVSGAFGLIQDTAVMYTIFLVNLTICGLRFVSDVSMIISKNPKAKGWF